MRSHNTSFFVFSLVLSLSLVAGSLFYGGKVKAASPIFYDATFDFIAGDYSTYNTTADFSYTAHSITKPFFESSGSIFSGTGAYMTNNTMTGQNAWNSFKIGMSSPEVLLNGGTFYVGYMFAFYEFGGYDYTRYKNDLTNTSIRDSFVNLVPPGSVTVDTDFGMESYIDFSFSYRSGANTSIFFDSHYLPDNGIVNGFDSFDGSNIPIGIGIQKSGSTSQLLESYGLSQAKFYNYGRPGDGWWKSDIYELKVTIDPVPSGYENWKVLVNPSNNIGAYNLTAFSYNTTVEINGELETVNMAYMPVVYILPVYCYAVSSTAYEPIQYILTDMGYTLSDISNSLSSLAALPTNEQLTWLENMRRSAATASQVAVSLATRGAYSFTKPVGYELESQLVAPLRDQQALPLIQIINGFLSHTKILAILTLAVVASIIGYIFFGKRG